jgi:hypothetical protein
MITLDIADSLRCISCKACLSVARQVADRSLATSCAESVAYRIIRTEGFADRIAYSIVYSVGSIETTGLTFKTGFEI